jgi:hypothetical protein
MIYPDGARRYTVLKCAGLPLPTIGSRFENTIIPKWSFTVVGMHPYVGTMRIILALDDGQERSYTESQFRRLAQWPCWKLNDMKEFTVP